MPLESTTVNLINQQDYVIESTDKQVTVTGTDFILPSSYSTMWQSKDLVIMANNLKLEQDIIMQGKNLTITCRQLETIKNITIDVSGNAASSFTSAANDGASAGARGGDGKKGKPGGNAGTINIAIESYTGKQLTCNATGGRGGNGQNGGNGATGAIGPDAEQGPMPKFPGERVGKTGGKGGRGGTAGLGGMGGDGGKAGTVTVQYIKPFDTNLLKIKTGGGLPGEAGADGRGGDGGKGGTGSYGWICSMEEVGDPDTPGRKTRLDCVQNRTRGPQGDTGDKGYGAQGNKINNNQTPNGLIEIKSVTAKELSIKFSTAWLGMQLHQSELDYLNRKFEEAGSSLLFLYQLLKNLVEYITDPAKSPISENDKDAIERYLKRVEILMVQLSQKLDYFGYYPEHVPLVSINVYKNFIDQLFPIGEKIEAAYYRYFTEKNDETIKTNAVKTVIGELNSKLIALKNLKEQLQSELADTREQVMKLLSQQMELAREVRIAREAFKQAVQKKAGCGLEDIIRAGTAIATISSGIGTIAGGISAISLVDDLVKTKKIKDTIEGKAKYMVGELKKVKGGLSEIQDGYRGIKDVLNKDYDGAKLLMDKDNFEDTVKQFEDMQEAREYRRVMRAFLDITEVRNKQVLFADAIVGRLNEIDSESEMLTTEITGTQARMIEISNPVSTANAIFFERAIARIKADILRALYMEFKALAYWALTGAEVLDQITDRSIDHLRTLHASFLSRHVQLIEERNAAPQIFNGPLEIVFSRSKYPELFTLLDKTGQTTFTIDINTQQYKDLSCILVDSAKIRIKGLNFSNVESYNCVLTHHGNPKFFNQSGNLLQYRHRRRALFSYYTKTDTNIFNLGGLEGTYSYLSPFATWSIQVNRVDDKAVDTTVIQEFGIIFSGVAFAKYN